MGHVLFIEIVGFAEQRDDIKAEWLGHLSDLVRATPQFQITENFQQLLYLESNSGVVLIFRTGPETALHSAIEISEALRKQPTFGLRMGIHSGPVSELPDAKAQRAQIAGAGIAMARRITEYGDAGHILLSKTVAQKLRRLPRWQPHLHDLGARQTPQGAVISLVNFFNEDVGNAALPEKFQQATAPIRRRRDVRATRAPASIMPLVLIGGSLLALGWFLANPPTEQSTPAAASAKPAAAPAIGKRVAVLPFTQISGDDGDPDLAKEIQQRIFNLLQKFANRQLSATHVTPGDLERVNRSPEDWQQLNVTHLLSGTLQMHNRRVRISVQLISADDGGEKWTQDFSGDANDLAAMEKEIASAIARRLQPKDQLPQNATPQIVKR